MVSRCHSVQLRWIALVHFGQRWICCQSFTCFWTMLNTLANLGTVFWRKHKNFSYWHRDCFLPKYKWIFSRVIHQLFKKRKTNSFLFISGKNEVSLKTVINIKPLTVISLSILIALIFISIAIKINCEWDQ